MNSKLHNVKRSLVSLLVLAMLFTMSGISAFAEESVNEAEPAKTELEAGSETPENVAPKREETSTKVLTDGIVTVESADPDFKAVNIRCEVKSAAEGLHDFMKSFAAFPATSLMHGKNGISIEIKLLDDKEQPINYEGNLKLKITLPKEWNLENSVAASFVIPIEAAEGYFAASDINDKNKSLENGVLTVSGSFGETVTANPIRMFVAQRIKAFDVRTLEDGVYDVQLAMLKDVETYSISMASNTLNFTDANIIKKNGRVYLRGHFNKGIVIFMPAFANKIYAVMPGGDFAPTTPEQNIPGTVISYHDEKEVMDFAIEIFKNTLPNIMGNHETDPADYAADNILQNGIKYIDCFVLDITDSIQNDTTALVGFSSDIMDSLFIDSEQDLPVKYYMGADNGYNTTNVMIANPVKSDLPAESLLPHKADLDMSKLIPVFDKYLLHCGSLSFSGRYIFTEDSYGQYFVPAWQKVYQARTYEKATQQDVDDAVRLGEEAFKKLVYCTVEQAGKRSSFSSLKYFLEAAKKKLEDEALYTSGSVRKLKEAVILAQASVDKGKAGLEKDSIEALNAIQTAMPALKLKATDFTALEAAIADAEKVDLDHKYTKASLDAFKEALEAAKAMLKSQDASEEDIEEQIKALMEAKAGLIDISDHKQLPNGKYEIGLMMKKPDKISISMANSAVKHKAILEVTDEGTFLHLDFNGIKIGAHYGYLSKLWYYGEGYKYLPSGQPEGDLFEAEVITTQKNKDGTDVIDKYNDKDNLYPDHVKIRLVNTALEDESGFVPVRVMVQIMEAITPGTGEQNVLIALNWDSLKEYDPSTTPEEEENETSPAIDVIDDATGIRVQAAEGVLPKGAVLKVKEITGGSEYDKAVKALGEAFSKFKLYDIKFVDPNGNEVQPLDIVTVSYPVPEGYAVLTTQLFRINEDGTKTFMKGIVTDGKYVVRQKHFSNYALADKSVSGDSTSAQISADNEKKSGGAPNTGDRSNRADYAVIMLAAVLTGSIYAYRRRKKGN